LIERRARADDRLVARSRRAVCVLCCAALASAAMPARGDGDDRPGDRFYFGLYGGYTDGGGTGGYEVSWWPLDYLGVLGGTSVTLAGPQTMGQGSGAVSVPDSSNFDWGLAVVGAVPLRYVQPYAGLWGGFQRSALAGNGTDFHFAYEPVAGVNAYVARNLRLYVEWRQMPIQRGIDGAPDPRVDVFALGVRWSPDAFRQARGVNKVDLVWGTFMGSCLLWLFINLMQYGNGGPM
jgi:hypothetical protein